MRHDATFKKKKSQLSKFIKEHYGQNPSILLLLIELLAWGAVTSKTTIIIQKFMVATEGTNQRKTEVWKEKNINSASNAWIVNRI